jgi:hypothetical protein
LYKRKPALSIEKPSEGKHDADSIHKAPMRDSNVAPLPSPVSSISSPAAAAAARDNVLNADNQVNVLQQPLVNQEAADSKVRTPSSSSNAPPVADRLPIMKSSSKPMASPEQSLGNVQFAVPFVRSSSSHPAPALPMQEVAVAGPPPHSSNNVNIEQLQSRIDQMLNDDVAPKARREV